MNEKLSMAMESYLETIAELQETHGVARTSDLAEQMSCKRSSVTNALQRLAQKGLINYQAYRPVTLTDKGQAAIKKLSRSHYIIEDFLENLLLLSPDFSKEEACRLEHNLAKPTIEGLKNLMDFLRQSNDGMVLQEIQSGFAKYNSDKKEAHKSLPKKKKPADADY
jgi:DtxR family Mn-dependent transcriptional regulator